MAISFQSDEEVLRKLRDRLRKMTDEELIRFGKEVRRLAENPFPQGSLQNRPYGVTSKAAMANHILPRTGLRCRCCEKRPSSKGRPFPHSWTFCNGRPTEKHHRRSTGREEN